MKIVVTGASGFIGGAIVHSLAAEKQYDIVAMGRSKCSKFEQYPNVSYLREDLSVSDSLLVCDVCIHSAGLADDHSSQSELTRNNVLATISLLKRLVGCRQFIFISSASVYSFEKSEVVKEENAELANDISNYGRSKLLAEKEVLKSKIASITILRPRAVYGLGDYKLLPRILNLVRFNRLIIPQNMANKTSITHIDNMVSIVSQCVQKPIEGVETLNVSDNKVYDMERVFLQLANSQQKENIKVWYIPEFVISMVLRISTWYSGASFNKQSLTYIRQNSVLDISKLKKKKFKDISKILDDFIG